MGRNDIIEEIAQKHNAMLADLKEYGRCNVCKWYRASDDTCHVGRPCDGKKEWEWRGTK